MIPQAIQPVANVFVTCGRLIDDASKQGDELEQGGGIVQYTGGDLCYRLLPKRRVLAKGKADKA